MSSSSLARIVKNSLYYFFSTITPSLLSYVYWFIVTKLVSPDVIGLASMAVSLSLIATSIAMIGIPASASRFMGFAYGRGEARLLREFFHSGLTLTLFLACLASMVAALTLHLASSETSLIVGLLVFATCLHRYYNSLFTSTERAKYTFYANLAGSFTRLFIGVLLVLVGLGVVGVLLGYVSFSLACLTLYLVLSFRLLRGYSFSLARVKELVKAGVAGWAPSIISTLGVYLGVLMVYGFKGASQTGLYFIAYLIATTIASINTSLQAITLPTLSGMVDGRKLTSWRVLKLSLALIAPTSLTLMVYSKDLLSLLGPLYVEAWLILCILLVGTLMAPMISSLSVLLYAYGLYSLVTLLGLTINLPRTLLYLTLTPIYGGLGAALSYTIGSFIGLVAAIIIARKVNFMYRWRILGLTFIAPLPLSLLSTFIHLPWIIGAPLIITLSLLTYAKIGVVTREDLRDLAMGLLPERIMKLLAEKFRFLLNLLYSD